MPELDNTPLVAVVVPVHDNWEDTQEFLESMGKVSYRNFRIVIVDDGSEDCTAEMLKTNYPDVIVVPADGTLWSAKAFNVGIEKAEQIGAEYVLQIDNDTTVAPDFLGALVTTAEENPGAIVTSKVFFFDQPDVLICTGATFSWLKGGYSARGYRQRDVGQYDQPCDVAFGVMGTLIRIEYIRTFGMVDNAHFPHWRWECDWLLRAQRAGFRCIYQPQSRVWHKVSRTARKSIYTTRRFLRSPLGTMVFALSRSSKGGPLSVRELIRFNFRHYRWWYAPYVTILDSVKRVLNELRGWR